MVTKPDYLRIGNIVKVQHWYGEIVDIAVSDSRIMVLVKSPKGVWRNHPAEWLEFDEKQITPASLDEAVNSFDFYVKQVKKMLADLEAMKASWQEKPATTDDGHEQAVSPVRRQFGSAKGLIAMKGVSLKSPVRENC